MSSTRLSLPTSPPLPTCDESGCPGHLGKFDSCRAEAVYEWSLDGMGDESTGDTDFEGYYSLFLVLTDETVIIDPDGERRTVIVPAGNYVLHSASSGAVSLWTYETEQAARDEIDTARGRYEEWDDVEPE